MQNSSNIQAKCIVVDDEPMARDILRRYIERIPTLHLEGEFGNAIDAAVFLQANEVDIAFLDIRMPQLTGTELVRSLRRAPKVIFTTAYKEYAFEGFELDVVDYLLKPIRFERFFRAVNKALPGKNDTVSSDMIAAAAPKDTNTFIYLRVDRKMVKVAMDDILFVESLKDYVKVVTRKEAIVTRQTIASAEGLLPAAHFIRIHRSYIVSINKIRSFTHEMVDLGGHELPVGKFYRNSFLKMLG
jgi:DNA-binding LytR/AlgR family response regulator